MYSGKKSLGMYYDTKDELINVIQNYDFNLHFLDDRHRVFLRQNLYDNI